MGAGGGDEILTQIRVRAVVEGQRGVDNLKESIKGVADQTKAAAKLPPIAPPKLPRLDADEAEREFSKISRSLKLLQADYAAGGVGVDSFNTKLRSLQDRALQLRQQSVMSSKAISDYGMISRASGMEIEGLGEKTGKTGLAAIMAGGSLSRVQNTMAGLAATTLGTSGRFNTLIGNLMQFAGGSNMLIGTAAIAGFALLAKGIELAGKAAKETDDRIKELVKTQAEFVSGKNKMGGTAAALFMPKEGESANLIEKQTEAQGRLRDALGGIRAAQMTNDSFAQAAAKERYATASDELGLITQKINRVKEELEIEKATLQLATETAGLTKDAARSVELRVKFNSQAAGQAQLEKERLIEYKNLMAELDRQMKVAGATELQKYRDTLTATKVLSDAQVEDLVKKRQSVLFAEQLRATQKALADETTKAIADRQRELELVGFTKEQVRQILVFEKERLALQGKYSITPQDYVDLNRARGFGGRPTDANAARQAIEGTLAGQGPGPREKYSAGDNAAAMRGIDIRNRAAERREQGLRGPGPDDWFKGIKRGVDAVEEFGKKSVAAAAKTQQAEDDKVRASQAASAALRALVTDALSAGAGLRDILRGKFSGVAPFLGGVSGIVGSIGSLTKAGGMAALGPAGVASAALGIAGGVAGLLGGIFGGKKTKEPAPVRIMNPEDLIPKPPPPPVFNVRIYGIDGREITDMVQVELARNEARDKVIRTTGVAYLPSRNNS